MRYRPLAITSLYGDYCRLLNHCTRTRVACGHLTGHASSWQAIMRRPQRSGNLSHLVLRAQGNHQPTRRLSSVVRPPAVRLFGPGRGLTVAGYLPLVQPLGMLCLTPMTRCLYSLHFQHTLSDPNESFWMSTGKKCPYTSIDSVRSRHQQSTLPAHRVVSSDAFQLSFL